MEADPVMAYIARVQVAVEAALAAEQQAQQQRPQQRGRWQEMKPSERLIEQKFCSLIIGYRFGNYCFLEKSAPRLDGDDGWTLLERKLKFRTELPEGHLLLRMRSLWGPGFTHVPFTEKTTPEEMERMLCLLPRPPPGVPCVHA